MKPADGVHNKVPCTLYVVLLISHNHEARCDSCDVYSYLDHVVVEPLSLVNRIAGTACLLERIR